MTRDEAEKLIERLRDASAMLGLSHINIWKAKCALEEALVLDALTTEKIRECRDELWDWFTNQMTDQVCNPQSIGEILDRHFGGGKP